MKAKDRRPRPQAPDAASRLEVRAMLGAEPLRRDRLIEYLHVIQDYCGHLPERLLAALAVEMKLSLAAVFEVASFYHHFDVVRSGEDAPPAVTVRICDSLSCTIQGSDELIARLRELLGPRSDAIRIQPVSCVGRCAAAPVAVVGTQPVERATVGSVIATIDAGSAPAEPPTGAGFDEYRAGGGYRLYERLLSGDLTAEAVLAQIEDAGLRGLGGAGFPAGRKWRAVAAQPGPRHLVVNADEGEPGTFKDRHFLESDPHRFLEGALVAACAVGCAAIWIYLRDEYAACRTRLEIELARLRQAFPTAPPIELRRGAGAYICGEESALIESLEGRRGEPRLRPPYVAERGLFGRPTLEHNLETLHWVRDIVERGAQWFAAQGRNGRQGPRSFSVSGRVRNPGVYVAPAGITLRELIDEYCGGMAEGHELYGYFPGGASGGMLPASLADLPLDFDTLAEHGCFIGSAAIIVFSRADSARTLAREAMRFFARESCGQCTPCRAGTRQAANLMSAPTWDVPLLQRLARTMQDASICGLGQAAPNPMLSVLRHFADEVES